AACVAWQFAVTLLLRPSAPRYDAVRELVAHQRDAIERAVMEQPPGATVCLPNQPVPLSVLFPGSVGVFMLFNAQDELEHRSARPGRSASPPRAPVSLPRGCRAAGSARFCFRPARVRRPPGDHRSIVACRRALVVGGASVADFDTILKDGIVVDGTRSQRYRA